MADPSNNNKPNVAAMVEEFLVYNKSKIEALEEQLAQLKDQYDAESRKFRESQQLLRLSQTEDARLRVWDNLPDHARAGVSFHSNEAAKIVDETLRELAQVTKENLVRLGEERALLTQSQMKIRDENIVFMQTLPTFVGAGDFARGHGNGPLPISDGRELHPENGQPRSGPGGEQDLGPIVPSEQQSRLSQDPGGHVGGEHGGKVDGQGQVGASASKDSVGNEELRPVSFAEYSEFMKVLNGEIGGKRKRYRGNYFQSELGTRIRLTGNHTPKSEDKPKRCAYCRHYKTYFKCERCGVGLCMVQRNASSKVATCFQQWHYYHTFENARICAAAGKLQHDHQLEDLKRPGGLPPKVNLQPQVPRDL